MIFCASSRNSRTTEYHFPQPQQIQANLPFSFFRPTLALWENIYRGCRKLQFEVIPCSQDAIPLRYWTPRDQSGFGTHVPRFPDQYSDHILIDRIPRKNTNIVRIHSHNIYTWDSANQTVSYHAADPAFLSLKVPEPRTCEHYIDEYFRQTF